MTKKEILEIIESNQFIKDNQEILKFVQSTNHLKTEENWFPDFPELKVEIDILKEELKEKIDKIDKKKQYLKDLNCKHEVRLRYHGGWINHSTCIFCEKEINGDNIRNGNTIYNSINRNRKCVMLDAEWDDEDCYYSGYSLNQVYDIIKNILNGKQEDEEINLLEEFKKLNLNKCRIDEREYQKEYYVLIIGGSNKHYINKTQYITSDKLSNSIDIAHLLCGVPHVNVELLDNEDIFETKIFEEKFPYYNRIANIRFDQYKTLDELNKKINSEKHVPFDIVIDMSSLIQYDQVVSPYQLKLKELFPNSYIINISKCESKSELELLKLLTEKLQTYQEAYAYTNEKYYYLNEENIESKNLENTCHHIKKLVLKAKQEV